MSILNYIEKMKEMYEGDRITAQEPRNMYSQGQLVTPSVDGSRPGYAGTGAAPLESKGISLTKDQLNLLKEKLTPQEFRKLKFGQPRKADAYDIGVFQRYKVTDPEVKSGVKKAGKKNRLFFKIQNILFPGKYETGGKILNNKKWTDTVIKLTKAGKSSDDITSVLMKSDKKINRNMVSSAINALVKQNKLDDKYTVMGGHGYTKAEMIEVDNIIKKEVAKGELGRADIGRKAEISDAYVERWIRKNKGDKFYETNYSYEKGLLKKGTLQKQKDLFNLVERGADLSLKNVNKALGIKNGKIVMADLVSTIYRMTGNRRTNSLVVPYDDEPRMREVLNKIRNSPDFEDIYQRRMGNLIRDAYEGKPILKEKALKAFNEYTQFNRQLRLVVPEIANQLDHVVPYQFLDEVKQGGNPINLIKVRPIPAAVNKFKSFFDKARIDVARELRINPNNLDALAKIKLLKDLEKTMPIEFGGISDKGHVYDFKQKPIGKSDLIADAKKSLQLYNETGKFSQKVLKDKALQKKIIDAGVGVGEDLSIFKTIKPLSKKRTLEITEILDNFWCGKKQSVAGGGRIGFSGSCPAEVKQKNFIAFNNDVRTGKITGEAAEKIAKKTSDVVTKAGSRSALTKLLGPAGIGLDVIYEVASVGTDIYGGKPWREAVQDNWIAGAFMPGTSQEEFHKAFFKKHPEAKAYGSGLLLEQAFLKKQKQIERLKASDTYRGKAEAAQQLPQLEKDLEGIAAQYNALGVAMEPGSPEYEAYMAAKTEYLDARKATSAATKAKLKMELDPIKSDRFKSYEESSPVKMDFSLPGNYTTFEPVIPSSEEVDKFYTKEGYNLSPQDIDFVQKLEKWNQLFNDPENRGMGIRGTQDWRGAGGGMVGIRKPSAIAPTGGPMSQGLRSLYNNVRKW